MSLGERFFTWLQTVWAHAQAVPPLSFVLALLDDLRGMLSGKPADASKLVIDTMGAIPTPPTIAAAMLLSGLTGKAMPAGFDQISAEVNLMLQNPAGYLSKKVREVESSRDLQEAAASISGLIEAVILKPLQDTAFRAEDDPLLVAAALHTAVLTAQLAAHTIGVSAEILGLGQIKTVESAMDSLLRGLGLEELAAIATRPLFTTGIEPAATRYFAKQFHPARLNAEQLVTLQALGVTDADTVQDEAEREGWRVHDISNIRELIYDRLGPSDILAARDLGIIDDTEAHDRLLKKRFHPDDATFLLTLSSVQRHQDWTTRVVQIVLRQYLKYQLDTDKLRSIFVAAGYSQERIEIETQVAQLARNEERVDLSVSEIESAFKDNVISESEAAAYLAKIQIDPSGIPVLLATWKHTKAKTHEHLNAAELTRAFHDGIIDKDQFSAKLADLGWIPEDVRTIVKIAEYRAPVKPRELSEGNILTAFDHEVINHGQAHALLVKLGFSDDDANFILRAQRVLPHGKQKELTTAEIAKLVELGVLTTENAIDRYKSFGYSDDDAELLLVALTTKLPKAPKKTKTPAAGG